MRVKVDIQHNLGPFLQQKARSVRKATGYGLGSTGKWLRLTLQRESPKEPRLNPFTGTISSIRDRQGRGKEVKVFRGRGTGKYRHGARISGGGFHPAKRSTRTEPLTKMRAAIRVNVNDARGIMRVGFLRPGMWAAMTRQEEGFSVSVTPRMRRMLFGIGVPLGALPQLRTPPRPWVTKVYRERGKEIVPMFEAAFAVKMSEISR
jgi:hypothetical protein